MTPVSVARTAFWNKMRQAMTAAGMVLRQNGDAEGAFSFNGESEVQVKLAMKLAGVRPKRRLSDPSPAQLAARVKFASRATSKA